MCRSGRSGCTQPSALCRFGSVMSRWAGGLQGTWLSVWLMMLSRLRFLSSVRAMYQAPARCQWRRASRPGPGSSHTSCGTLGPGLTASRSSADRGCGSAAAGCGRGNDPEHPRAHPLGDPLDRAPSRRCPGRRTRADLGARRFDPLVHGDEFAVQGSHLALVLLALHLRQRAGSGLMPRAGRPRRGFAPDCFRLSRFSAISLTPYECCCVSVASR
jgi:hypothetical protein